MDYFFSWIKDTVFPVFALLPTIHWFHNGPAAIQFDLFVDINFHEN